MKKYKPVMEKKGFINWVFPLSEPKRQDRTFEYAGVYSYTVTKCNTANVLRSNILENEFKKVFNEEV